MKPIKVANESRFILNIIMLPIFPFTHAKHYCQLYRLFMNAMPVLGFYTTV